MRPHPRRTATNPTDPHAWGTCDRSGFVGLQHKLQWQFEWQGTKLINQRILCVPDQIDKPNRQLGTIILPPDPVSIPNARPEIYPVDELWELMTEYGNGHGAIPIYLEETTTSNNPNNTPLYLALELSTIQADDVDTS